MSQKDKGRWEKTKAFAEASVIRLASACLLGQTAFGCFDCAAPNVDNNVLSSI